MAPASDSYLNGDKIIEIARECGADAIHPGYGFLAENADFAEQCESAGLTFIGPSAESMRLLGDKLSAREIAKKAGVPLVPGTNQISNLSEAMDAVRTIGLPLMIKAAAGGGGRGIRLVDREEDLEGAISQAMHEAGAAFGNSSVYIEKALTSVRHIEVQIIADNYGNIVPIGERECSIQRRHQKIIEECPSAVLTPDQRHAITRAAVRIASTASYTSLGTVEFLVTPEGDHYFLEVNTRLQVEHPVTEMAVGVDLLKDQILLASGEELAYDESELPLRGCAIECRIVAEDPFNNFLPSVGKIVFTREPAGPGIRVESALFDGMEVTPFYDSLIAKVTAWGRTREGARSRMLRALSEFRVVGVATNIPYLQQVLELDDFINANLDTGFLDRHFVTVEEPLAQQKEAAEIAALILVIGGAAGAPSNGALPGGVANGGRAADSATPSTWRQTMGGMPAGRGAGRWPKSI
jgi:acetyl/propionyl-CoA carboxylase alpha subunit